MFKYKDREFVGVVIIYRAVSESTVMVVVQRALRRQVNCATYPQLRSLVESKTPLNRLFLHPASKQIMEAFRATRIRLERYDSRV